MTHRSSKRIVVLGLMARFPYAGVAWQTVHYLVGLQRLGCDVYYVEAHGKAPRELGDYPDDELSLHAAAYIHNMLSRFDLGDRWVFHALHLDGQCYGLSQPQLEDLYRTADLVLNLHGATNPPEELVEAGRLIYLETDPALLQIELHWKKQSSIDFLERHRSYFTFGENYGKPDCLLPVSQRFHFQPTRQPVVTDFWAAPAGEPEPRLFTTIGNWRQDARDFVFRGEKYTWSKHTEFLKFIELPSLTSQSFELAMSSSSLTEADLDHLAGRGWGCRDSLGFSDQGEINGYRGYIWNSRGEFTVAKDQNVRLRSGWFSDRSATYLAAGRPVITQETGFSNILPTGEGLFAFSTMDEILDAVDRINSDYAKQSKAARDIAEEYFAAERVLADLLERAGA